MSPASNILCVICTENFEASDTIYNTSCGHVFHENCIKHWRGRSTECPVCRARYANMQKLFLNFDENAGSASAMDELQTKLESCESNMDKLYKQLNDGEVNFMRLQGQYTLALEDINLLNGQLSKRNDSENNFMALQKQYTEAEDIIKNLKDKNQYLLLQCEGKNKEIQLKTLEISTLKDTMGCMETSVGGSDSILKQQLKIMEQKLRHITGELQKEISISMQLSIDKMRLQSLVDQYGATKTEPSPNFVNNIQKQKPIEKENEKLTEKETIIKDSTHLTSVVIKRFPSHHIRYPLIDVISALATAMGMPLSPYDIHEVRILEQRNARNCLPNMVSLLVKFKTLRLKINFLNNKSKVKDRPEYGSILIYEYMDADTNYLFVYAKQKLTALGFANIFCQNGQVMAAKARQYGAKVIHIKSTAQVDDILSSNTESITEGMAKGIAKVQCLATNRNESNSSIGTKEASKDESDLKYDEDFYARQ